MALAAAEKTAQEEGTGTPRLIGFLEPRLRPWGLVTAAGVLLCIATAMGFLGRFWWLLDLTSHFRVQYAILLAAAALVMLLPRAYRFSLVFAGFSLINAATILPLYFGRSEATAPVGRTLRVMLINVNSANTNYAAVKETIGRYAPDLFLIEEANSAWLEGLQDMSASYPWMKAQPRSDNFGIALFSKHPLDHAEIVEIGEAGVPSVMARVDVDGTVLTVLGTHPLPPGGSDYSRLRNDQLAALPGFLEAVETPVVLLGDLNATPWCWHFRRLLRRTGLRNSSRGWGVQPTWPVFSVLFRIPIDHLLHSPDLRVVQRAIGPDVGSDHYPVVVDLRLP